MSSTVEIDNEIAELELKLHTLRMKKADLGKGSAPATAAQPKIKMNSKWGSLKTMVKKGDLQGSMNKASEVQTAFDEIDKDGDGQLTYTEFVAACKGVLKMNLSEVELGRIFDALDTDDRKWIDFEQFKRGVRKHVFLKEFASPSVGKIEFEVAEDYDFTKTTNDYYKTEDGNLDFFGDFVDIRSGLDYGYHVNYTKERQLWQDAVVRSVAVRITPQPSPWIVYTCGPMGAGKGYCLSFMSSQEYLKLENIVHIDPDHFKSLMPEWNGYTKLDSEQAGSMTHKESGFIQEIVQENSLKNSQNIWVDGSLHDADWFVQVFERVRRDFPHYRIAIFLIHASEVKVRERIAKRAKQTGRDVPEEMITKSLQAPEHSLKVLTPKVDFVARINNDGGLPALEAFEKIDHTGNWDNIKQQFTRVDAAKTDFPERLSPLFLLPMKLSEEDVTRSGNKVVMQKSWIAKSDAEGENDTSARKKAHEEFLMNAIMFKCDELEMSEPHAVNFPDRFIESGAIPERTHFYAWVYPKGSQNLLASSKKKAAIDIQQDANVLWLLHGGFIFLDQNKKIVGAAPVSADRKRHMIQFGVPSAISVEGLDARKRTPTQFQYLVEGGATHCSYVDPSDAMCGQFTHDYQYGGFVYKMSAGNHIFFPILDWNGATN